MHPKLTRSYTENGLYRKNLSLIARLHIPKENLFISKRFRRESKHSRSLLQNVRPRAVSSSNPKGEESLVSIETLQEFADDILPYLSSTEENNHAPPTSAPTTNRELALRGKYMIRESIAAGSYGRVVEAESICVTTQVVAIIVPKDILYTAQEKESVIREGMIHEGLAHPNIIKLVEAFQDEIAHYFILEKAPNVTMNEYIQTLNSDNHTEAEHKVVFRQLMEALKYLHSMGVVHHDIKPENILLSEMTLKLCDFGAARAYNIDRQIGIPFEGLFGTSGYFAPELLLGQSKKDCTYDTGIDVWSAGIVLFEMMYKYNPFYPYSDCTELDVEFPSDRYGTISEDGKDLLRKMLNRDEKDRISAEEVLQHAWFLNLK